VRELLLPSVPIIVSVFVLGSGCSGPAARPSPASAGPATRSEPDPPATAQPVVANASDPVEEPVGAPTPAEPGAGTPVAVEDRGGREQDGAADLVVVESDRSEIVMLREGSEIGRFPVALGRGGVGKRRRGDEMTPRGRYRLLEPAPSARFHHFVPLSYPNADDIRRGLDRGFITRAEHDRMLAAIRAGGRAPQDTALGGHIGIHAPEVPVDGSREPSDGELRPLARTGGCIVMRAADLEAFLERIETGTRIEIR
jgi:lipoprotein-anchoring transpeptidase ErfK/SrfK